MRTNQSLLQRFVALLIAILAIGVLPSSAATREIKYLQSQSGTSGITLSGNYYYYVISDVTISGKDCCNALQVESGATAVIYIAKGKTLTVSGGNAYCEKAAGCGIEVPSNSTLIITGEGSIVASGGNAADGGNGADGGAGWINYGANRGAGGSGGAGGYGGGGAAPGIGGVGGSGAQKRQGPDGITRRSDFDVFDGVGLAGNDCQPGQNGAAMGTVYVLGKVAVNAYPGKASTKGGAAGNHGSNKNDKGSGWFNDYAAGGGGPGGGGGSGYGALFGVGGGAPGAQCGASGSSGGTYSKHSGYRYLMGLSGAGGRGYVNGAKNLYVPGDKSAAGGAENDKVAVSGSHGNLYTEGVKRIGNRDGRALIDYPEAVKFSVALETQGGESRSKQITAYLGKPFSQVEIPQRRDYYFLGYYTQPEGGEQVYDINGKSTRIYDWNEPIKLYAHWTDAVAVNVTHSIAYTTTLQDALDRANVGDVLRLNLNTQQPIIVRKPITLDLGGTTHEKIYVQLNEKDKDKGTLYINNGTVGLLDGSETVGALFSGNVEVSNLHCSSLFCDGYNYTINSGTYDNIYNTVGKSEKQSQLGSVTIKGDHTFVGLLNPKSSAPGRIVVMGGVLSKEQADLIKSGAAAERMVSVPAQCELITLEDAPEGAPSLAYTNQVVMRKDFKNYVVLKNEYFNPGLALSTNPDDKTKLGGDKVEIKLHFKANSLQPGLNTIFGCSTDGENSKDGFGLYIDGTTHQFVFACGGAFEYSPKGIALEGKEYWVSLKRGHFRVDDTADATSDYYHKDLAIYQAQYTNHSLTLGAVASNHTQTVCDLSVYDYQIFYGGTLIGHYVPAYGFQTYAQHENFAMYDLIGHKLGYNGSGKPFADMAVGECQEHPAYRVSVSTIGAKRTCVICGAAEEAEPFVETPNIIFTPAVETGATYKLHYVSREGGNFTEVNDTLGTTQCPKVENMKFFSLKVEKAGKLLHHYVPVGLCSKIYIYDLVKDTYESVLVANASVNFEISGEHKYINITDSPMQIHQVCTICKGDNIICKHVRFKPEYTERDGVRYLTCDICRAVVAYDENRLVFNAQQSVELPTVPTNRDNILFRMTIAVADATQAHKSIMRSPYYNLFINGTDLYDATHTYKNVFTPHSMVTFEYDGKQIKVYDTPTATTDYRVISGTSETHNFDAAQPKMVLGGYGSDGAEFDLYAFAGLTQQGGRVDYIPALRGGSLAMVDGETLDAYPLSQQAIASQPTFKPCRVHKYIDYAKHTDEYGVTSWKAHCLICDGSDVLTSESTAMAINNGAAFELTNCKQSYTYALDATAPDGKKPVLSDVSYFLDDGSFVFGVKSTNPTFRFSELRVSDEKGNLLHHYLPSIWQGEVALYDIKEHKHFFNGMSNKTSVYAPTCKVHRYYDMDISGTGANYRVTRHCHLCDARIVESGLQVDSVQMIEGILSQADTARTKYLDLLRGNGEIVSESYVKLPEIGKSDLVFSLSVMDQGKLIHHYLPALRKATEAAGATSYGLYDVMTESFIPIEGATASINECLHPYFTLLFKDGKINKHCHLCDETFDVVGYYLDITYQRTADETSGPQMSQRIMRLNDGTDGTDHSLLPNSFRRGAYFFGGWQSPQGEKQPGDELLPSSDLNGSITVPAIWRDGFIVNGDTLEINDANTRQIHIIDNGTNPFIATKAFTAGEMSYTRDLNAAQGQTWGTLCLPFATESSEVVQFYVPTDVVTEQGGRMSIVLQRAERVEGGQPCIFQVLNPTALTQKGVLTLQPADKAGSVSVANEPVSAENNDLRFVGSYLYDTFDCTNKSTTYFGIAGDKFLRTERQMTVRPYHAHIETTSGSHASIRQMLFMIFSEDLEGITKVVSDNDGDNENGGAEYYRLDGTRSAQQPISGFYIVNGRKMIKK